MSFASSTLASPSIAPPMVNITAFILQYATATSTALSIPSPTYTLSSTPPSFLQQSVSIENSLLTMDPSLPHLCDWTRSASDCRDYEFVRWMLVTSAVLHALMGTFGVLLLVYRNRGWNRKVFTELFSMVGTGIRPKPMDCIVFFVCIACFIKVPANLVLFFDVLRDSWWLRVAIEQMYWVVVSFAFSNYFVGLLYAMPVTTREGIFAVYQPETSYGSKPLRPIHVLTPTAAQKNCMLATGAIYPLIGAALGIASGAMHDLNKPVMARKLILAQYSNWAMIHFSLAVMFFYYGLKYTFILRANIIVAEQALKAPRAAFGIGNLISRSPARFLFIQLQITGFGGSAVMVLAGFLCLIWVLCGDRILAMQQPNIPRAMGFFWTCAIAVAYFVIMILIAVQSIKNRRREINNNTSTTTTGSPHPSGGRPVPTTGTRASINKGTNIQSHLSGGVSSNAIGPFDSSKGSRYMSSDPEACLSQVSSNDFSTLHSVASEKPSIERPRESFYDGIGSEELTMHAAAVARGGAGGSTKGYESDRDSLKAPASLTPPPRPLPAPLSLSYGLSYGDAQGRNQYDSITPPLSPTGESYTIGSHHFSLLPTGPSPSQIRESVFGGRTPREETSSSSSRDRTISPPPQSPTSPTSPTIAGFHLPSFSRSSLKSGKRNSVPPRVSTSSLHSATPTAATSTTTTTTTAGSCTRPTRSPSIRQHQQQPQGQMSSLSLSTTLTNSSTISIQATPPSSSNLPQPLRQLSQPLPVAGPQNGSRKKSNAGLTVGSSSPATAASSNISLSAPIPSSSASASRGAGGGYKNYGIEMVSLNPQK